MGILSGNARLKTGYTTGTCAAAAFQAALDLFYKGETSLTQKITLPGQTILPPGPEVETATLAIENSGIKETSSDPIAFASVRKPVNDDEDATKNIVIRVSISSNPDAFAGERNPREHRPLPLGSSIFLYAGRGTGVVTLPGLKVLPGYPAINPGPQEMMKGIASKYDRGEDLYVLVSVENGEEVAKRTANEKVGVMGGISILGSRGIVKPLSNEAYLESVAVEISVALKLHNSLCFALGNSSVAYAKQEGLCQRENLIETGNFIQESLLLLKGKRVQSLTFVAGTGKMARLSLGYGNTHSHMGPASPAMLASLPGLPSGSPFTEEELSSHATFRGMEEALSGRSDKVLETILKVIVERAQDVFYGWIKSWNEHAPAEEMIRIDSVCMILLDHTGNPHRTCHDSLSSASEFSSSRSPARKELQS